MNKKIIVITFSFLFIMSSMSILMIENTRAAPLTSFGYVSGAVNYWTNMSDVQCGSPAVCPYNTVARNISVYIRTAAGTYHIRGALYNNATNAVIIGTEEKVKTYTGTGYAWVTMNLTTNTTLTLGTTYLIAAYADYDVVPANLCYTTDAQNGIKHVRQDSRVADGGYPSWSDPWSNTATGSTTYYMVKCGILNSTAGWVNRAPTFSFPGPGNATTSIALYNRTSVKVSDLDGNATTVCFWNNKTGSWVKAQQNNSFPANNTVCDMSSSWASSFSTEYWWRVTAYDGHVNSSVIYHFTTLAAGAYSGPDYYVNGTSGDDGNNGSFAYPFKTIQKALNSSTPRPGKSIIIRGGTYTILPNDLWYGVKVFWSAGTAGNWFTIKSYNNEVVIINSSNCAWSGASDFSAVFFFSDSNYIHLSGLTFNHSARNALTFTKGGNPSVSHVIIDNCSFTNNAMEAIKIFNGDNITIEHCYIYNNFCNWSNILPSVHNEVVSMETCSDFNINNNTFRGNRQLNIDIKGGGSRGKVCYNTINTTAGHVKVAGYDLYGNVGIYIDSRGIVKNISIYNNNIYGNNSGISLNTETTGHYEYIYIYNNIVNMTKEPFGVNPPIGTGRIALGLGKTGSSTDVFHHIYVYDNLLRTGLNNIYSVFQIGSWDGGQFSSTNLQHVYIVNNIFCTSDVGSGADQDYLMRFGGITWVQGLAIFTINNNSFYSSTETMMVHWGTTDYDTTNTTVWGGERVITDPVFVTSADQNGDFHLQSSSPCIDVGNDTLVPVVDFDGVNRTVGFGPDIGAYEYTIGSISFPVIMMVYNGSIYVWKHD